MPPPGAAGGEPIVSRVLVIDDEPGFRISLSEVLRLEGYTPVGASTCQEALVRLASESVDLAFVDVNLPDGSGLDLLPRADPPVVVVTGEPSLSLADEALSLGARDCLAKPIDRLRLRMTLASLAREQRLRAEIARLQAEVAALRTGGPRR
jgi:DNA-binding NtrC family response regulator